MQVPLLGTGVKSKSAVVNAQRRLNCYYEPQLDQDKSAMALYGTPGLSLSLDNGAPVIRGGLTEGDYLYVAQGDKLLRIDNGFAITDLNAASRFTTNAGRVSMASSGTVIVIADGTNAYRYDISAGVFAQIASAMLASPQTVTWQDGQFVATFNEAGVNKKRAQISADGTTWNALDYRAVESTPGALLRTFSDHGEVHQFCDTGIEFWAYTGDPTFPFQPIRGATLPIGLAARWSLAAGAQALYFLGRDRSGAEAQVYEMVGHQARVISTPDLCNLINGYATIGAATGYIVNLDQHTFYVLSFPAAGKTWMYDCYSSDLLQTPVWTELQTNGGRHASDLGFRLVNGNYVTDYGSAKLYKIDKTVYTDNGVAIEREVDTRHFFKDYELVTVDSLTIDFETGVGLAVGQGSDPEVMLAVSRDGGRTFGAEQWKKSGKIGEYPHVEWTRLGTARDFVFKLRQTDPVKFVINGIGVRASPEVPEMVG